MDPPTNKRYLATDMDDVHQLLNLEAMCRYQADVQHVNRKLEEKMLQWIDAKYQYQQEYARLTRLIKCVGMCVAVDSRRDVEKENSDQTLKVLKNFQKKIISNVRPVKLNANVVEKCRQELDTVHKPRSQLSRQKRQFAEIQEALQNLGSAVDKLENGFELKTMRALDQMVAEMVPSRIKSG